MEINRNQYFLAGLVLLFLGIQFRMVETVELTPEFTQFLLEKKDPNLAAISSTAQAITGQPKPVPGKLVAPPEWIGWSLISLGAVLVLHSLAMKKPGT